MWSPADAHQLGVGNAAALACPVMALPQVVVVALLVKEGRPVEASIVFAVLLGHPPRQSTGRSSCEPSAITFRGRSMTNAASPAMRQRSAGR